MGRGCAICCYLLQWINPSTGLVVHSKLISLGLFKHSQVEMKCLETFILHIGPLTPYGQHLNVTIIKKFVKDPSLWCFQYWCRHCFLTISTQRASLCWLIDTGCMPEGQCIERKQDLCYLKGPLFLLHSSILIALLSVRCYCPQTEFSLSDKWSK